MAAAQQLGKAAVVAPPSPAFSSGFPGGRELSLDTETAEASLSPHLEEIHRHLSLSIVVGISNFRGFLGVRPPLPWEFPRSPEGYRPRGTGEGLGLGARL